MASSVRAVQDQIDTTKEEALTKELEIKPVVAQEPLTGVPLSPIPSAPLLSTPSAAPTSRVYYTQARIDKAGFEAELARLDLQKADLEEAFQTELRSITTRRDNALEEVDRVIGDTMVSFQMAVDKMTTYEQWAKAQEAS